MSRREQQPTPYLEEHVVRVMTWNIRTGIGNDPAEPGRRAPVDLDRIARVIADLRPDVVALQEVDRHRDRTGYVDQPAVLGELTGMTAAYAPILIDDAGEYGLAVLTAHPIVASGWSRFPLIDGWEPRGVLDVVVQIGDRPVRVLNTHLQIGFDGRDGEAAIQREDSARVLALRMQASVEPAVLMGDFNADPASPELLPLSVATDGWAEKGEGGGMTIPASPFEEPSSRIDAIFVDERFLVRGCAVIRSQETALASDHYPVVVDLVIAP